MSELHIQELLDNYHEDVQDYEKLLKLMNEFEKVIDDEQNKDKNNILSEEHDPSADNKMIVEALKDFSAQREEWFAKIMDRKKITDNLVKTIDKNDQNYNKLFAISEQLSAFTKEIIESDERIIAKLKIELEFVKLELKRLGSSKKVINVYAKKNVAEPRFIDKIK
jgi:hypothetical protein